MKSGIDYFPLDVALDSKFELIEAEFGLAGFAVVVKLFQRIYSGFGYYCEWTKEVALLFGKSVGLGGNAVSEIVSASIKRGIFNRDFYDKYQILTSKGIQKRYFEIASRRKEIEVVAEYLLVKVDQICKNANIKPKNVNISSENVNIREQSNVEESKEEYIYPPTPQGGAAEPPVPYAKIMKMFNSICVSYPKVRAIDGARKKSVGARFKTYGDIAVFKTLFEKTEASLFLKGKNDRSWQADFDWITRPTNMAKVLEGKYDNGRGTKSQVETSADMEDFEKWSWEQVKKLAQGERKE